MKEGPISQPVRDFFHAVAPQGLRPVDELTGYFREKSRRQLIPLPETDSFDRMVENRIREWLFRREQEEKAHKSPPKRPFFP